MYATKGKGGEMKIYLADLIHDYFSGNYVVPLNIGLIKAFLHERYRNELEIYLFKSPEKLLNSLKKESAPHLLAFLIAFSFDSWIFDLKCSTKGTVPLEK